MKTSVFKVVSILLFIAMNFIALSCNYKQNSEANTRCNFTFPPADSLPDNLMMPDPFKRLDGTRITNISQWPGQRIYLKALLQHYLYGHIPPRPEGKELTFTQLSDENYIPPNSMIEGRKQEYSVHISRNSMTHTFNFTLWRPEKLIRYPTLINNYPRLYSTQPTYSMEEGVRRGYMVVVYNRTEVAPDDTMNADTWCRIHWRDTINKYRQRGHDQGPEEYNAIYDFADEFFFKKHRGSSTFNIAPNSNTWRYDPVKYPLLTDWNVPD